jgi:hypothetical protein
VIIGAAVITGADLRLCEIVAAALAARITGALAAVIAVVAPAGLIAVTCPLMTRPTSPGVSL